MSVAAGTGVTIWDEWADEPDGDLGPVYGVQWTQLAHADRRSVDQIAEVDQAAQKATPTAGASSFQRGNERTLKMALPPCHAFFQFL